MKKTTSIKAAEKQIDNMVTLFDADDAPVKRGCYAEQLALEFFRRAIAAYAGKRIDPDIFGPLVRNIADESCVYAFRDSLSKGKKDEFADSDGVRVLLSDIWNKPAYRTRCRRQLLAWADSIIAKYEERSKDDPLRERLAEVKSVLRLNDTELAVLEALWLMSTSKLESIAIPYCISSDSGFISLVTGVAEESIRIAMSRGSRLVRFGVLCHNVRGRVHDKICSYLEGMNDEPLSSAFYKRDDEEPLPVEFFGELAKKHLPILKRMLTGKNGRKLNILLYGAPGTGKTSFARALAKESGRIAYRVAQRPKNSNGDFREAAPEIRYCAVEICDEQTDHDSSLIVVDEADALLRGHTGMNVFGMGEDCVGDKGLLNDILERIETPTIWISNTRADELDSSSRRRFDYAIRFEPLSFEQRLETWRNASVKAGAGEIVSDEMLARFAKRYPVSTGIAAQALNNLVRVGAKPEEAESIFGQLLERQSELSGIASEDSRVLQPAADYSTEGLNIKSGIPLAKIERAVKRFLDGDTVKGDKDAPRMNILLTGVPGSGKTEFVKYLAKSVGRPLIMLRPSDLKSKWVGETEQNIAAAFRNARERKAVLFFDEVDTFLDNREAVQQGHEKSAINEVLQQMESFGGLFIGTTNFKGMLDPAVARRFTFKIELDSLDSAGRRHFWRQFFGCDISESGARRLDALDGLTPGDFRTVRQELYYLGDEISESDRLDALATELSNHASTPRRIGFACE